MRERISVNAIFKPHALADVHHERATAEVIETFDDRKLVCIISAIETTGGGDMSVKWSTYSGHYLSYGCFVWVSWDPHDRLWLLDDDQEPSIWHVRIV